MDPLEASLRDLGIDVSSSYENVAPSNSTGGDSLAFSGYGVFTPITVRSGTKVRNANLERDQPGN